LKTKSTRRYRTCRARSGKCCTPSARSGIFAAHPIKSTNTSEIVEVEPGEAEWLVAIFTDVFDEFYVKPANQRERIEALNERLRDASKSELPMPDPPAPPDSTA
jgi:2-polyprenyl-6-methoxyphenol hydroxylase-like FAD-dependent oxidoreductase